MKVTTTALAERDGFSGTLYAPAGDSRRAVILMAGDSSTDFLTRAFARWLTDSRGLQVLALGVLQTPGQDSGVHGWALERVERAAAWLKERGMEKVGAVGISMQAVLLLSAAARIPDISLTVAFSPCDYVPWGFTHGQLGREKNAEWPTGGSLCTWRGEELPFQPAGLGKEAYWRLFEERSREYKEMHSLGNFEQSEERRPIAEEAFIPAERCSGPLILIGAEDDSMWASARYIRRLEKRLREKRFPHPVHALIYPRGTHLLVPETMLKKALPLVGGAVPRMFDSGRSHGKECKAARRDLDEKLSELLDRW